MTIVAADGQNVRPVAVEEFQIGNAETYDVIVQPTEDRAFTFVAETIDRAGMARATLAPRLGMVAAVPPLRERPALTMKDMGHGGMDHGAMGHGGMDHGAMDMAGWTTLQWDMAPLRPPQRRHRHRHRPPRWIIPA
jgi:FtsP/CotA-like multicopper oxidase with cupredoxin domain